MKPFQLQATNDHLEYKHLEKHFPQSYLETYYSEIEEDEIIIGKFLVKSFKKIHYKIKKRFNVLELGIGPTVHHLIPAVPYASKIDARDYLKKNLSFVKKWIQKSKTAHNWNPFTSFVLLLENKKVNSRTISKRENDLRKKIGSLLVCDLRKGPKNIDFEAHKVVTCFYVTEEIALNKKAWEKIIKNIADFVQPKGFLIMSFLEGTNYYHLKFSNDHHRIPTCRINKNDVHLIFNKLGFTLMNLTKKQTPSQKRKGVSGILLVLAYKNP